MAVDKGTVLQIYEEAILNEGGVSKADASEALRQFGAMLPRGDAREIRDALLTTAVRAGAFYRSVDESKKATVNHSPPVVMLFCQEALTELKANALLHIAVRLQARCDELERRLEESPLKYVGSFTEGVQYRGGNFVSHAGSVWHANVTTRQRPGAGEDWTLAVKRGRDGKDAQ